jgi:hypothetical protein
MLFLVIGIAISSVCDNLTGFGISTGITILFIVIFGVTTPSFEQMIENDYYAMLENKPKCIDASNVSLGCKKDYIVWQKDSITKQYSYDSVKVMLDNEQKEILK